MRVVVISPIVTVEEAVDSEENIVIEEDNIDQEEEEDDMGDRILTRLALRGPTCCMEGIHGKAAEGLVEEGQGGEKEFHQTDGIETAPVGSTIEAERVATSVTERKRKNAVKKRRTSTKS